MNSREILNICIFDGYSLNRIENNVLKDTVCMMLYCTNTVGRSPKLDHCIYSNICNLI